jgi:hypothetical protein
MEAMKKALAVQFLGNRLFIMGLVGVIILLIVSFQPLQAVYLALACVALATSIAWDLWRGAGKGAKYGMAVLLLLMGLFLLLNTLLGWVDPAKTVLEPSLTAAQLDGAVAAGLTTWGAVITGIGEHLPYAFATLGGAIASLLFIIGGLMGIMAARMSE